MCLAIFTAWRSAGAVYAMTLCLSVSVTSRSSAKTAQWIELIFGTEASFEISYTVLKENSGNSKKGTSFNSLRDFVPNSGLRKFRHRKSVVARCCQ